MKQTAVEWLIEQFYNDDIPFSSALFKKAKELEKEQTIDTCRDVDNTDFWVKYESFEQYYKDTYGTDIK